jgi:hypothetical protein
MMGKNMQKVLFKDYIEPLLKSDTQIHSREILLDLASRAFYYGVQSREIKKAMLYQSICNEIYQNEETKELVSDVFFNNP